MKNFLIYNKEKDKSKANYKLVNYLVVISFIFMISFVSSFGFDELLGTFKQNECMNLIQTCSNCTYVNITKVSYPNSTLSLSNVEMTKDGTYYNYTYCNTELIGIYFVTGVGDENGIDIVWDYSFEITPTGFLNSISFYILILILSLGLVILGLAISDAPITILGSVGLYFLGLYILFFGLVDIRDPVYTWAIGIIVLGLAFYISTKASHELIGTDQ